MMKLNSRGISHLLLPITVVLVVAVAGTVALVASHADSVAVPTSARCKRGLTLVNAVPNDYVSGKSKSAAVRGHGMLCVKNPNGRERISAPNYNTISAYYKCPANSTLAYDRSNPDGTGFHTRWKVKSHFGGQVGGVKTYYCIKMKDLYVNLNQKGKKMTLKNIPGAAAHLYTTLDGHNYHFYPAYDLRDGCNADEYKHTACRPNFFFSYYFTEDTPNRT